MTNPGVFLLLVLSGVLSGAMWLELHPGRHRIDLPADRRSAMAGPNRPAVVAETDGAWQQSLLARPLFAPLRRPYVAPAAMAAAPSAPAAMPRVAGIVIHGKDRFAIFAGEGDGRPVTVAEGGSVGGVRIMSIADGQVVVTGLGGLKVLRPTFDPHPGLVQPAMAALLPVPAPQPDATAAFNGPPGLDHMPKPVGTLSVDAPPAGVLLGSLPAHATLTSGSNLTGIPGLTIPSRR